MINDAQVNQVITIKVSGGGVWKQNAHFIKKYNFMPL